MRPRGKPVAASHKQIVPAQLTVAAVVALKMLYVEDTLGDESVDVPGEPGNQAKRVSRNASREAPRTLARHAPR
jgi:hypothetical protein